MFKGFFKLAVLFVLVTEFLKLLFYYECFNITFTYSDIVYLISYSYFIISYCFICFRVLALRFYWHVSSILALLLSF